MENDSSAFWSVTAAELLKRLVYEYGSTVTGKGSSIVGLELGVDI